MKNAKVLVATITALFAFFSIAGAAPNLTIPGAKVDIAPVIDGVIDDAAWVQASQKGAKAVVDQAHTGDFLTQFPRISYVAYDDNYLYVAFVNYSPNPQGLETKKPFWQNDVVEFFIQPPGKKDIQFAADSIGRVNDNVNKYDASVGLQKTAIQWNVEMAVPWAKVGVTPKPGDVWRFHLNGHQVADGDVWVTWNATFGTFHNLDRFGYIVFGE